MSALGKAHALGRPVSVTPATAVPTVRCNAASLLATCFDAACMHSVASFQQLSAVLQHIAMRILACIAVTQRTWPHLLCVSACVSVRVCVCVCVRARLRIVWCSNASNATSSIKHPVRMPSSLLTPDYSCMYVSMSCTVTVLLRMPAVRCVSCTDAGGGKLQQWCCGRKAAVLSVRCARQKCHLLSAGKHPGWGWMVLP